MKGWAVASPLYGVRSLAGAETRKPTNHVSVKPGPGQRGNARLLGAGGCWVAWGVRCGMRSARASDSSTACWPR